MSISAETVVSVVIGGLITWGLAHLYFRKQDHRAVQIFEAQARFLENLANVVTKGGSVSLNFTRHAKGRITNAGVTVTPEPAVSTWVVPAPTVTRGKPGSTSEHGQNTDSGTR